MPAKKCIEFLDKRFMQTDRKYLSLPLQLTDMQAAQQEHYERMQKQSKSHIARAKRSVQGGQEPDDELLRKADAARAVERRRRSVSCAGCCSL